MEQRSFDRLGRQVGVIGLGAWQLGADWGEVSEDDALAVLDAAVESGVTFLDTADVYGDGRSEQLIGRSSRGNAGPGSPSPPRWAAGSTQTPRRTPSTTSGPGPTGPGPTSTSTPSTWCSCTARHAVFAATRSSTASTPWSPRSASPAYGVSVETCDQALTAIAGPGRGQRPDHPERVPAQAARRGAAGRRRGRCRDHRPGAAASGLLSGRYDERTTFAADDHRTYNRHGEASTSARLLRRRLRPRPRPRSTSSPR